MKRNWKNRCYRGVALTMALLLALSDLTVIASATMPADEGVVDLPADPAPIVEEQAVELSAESEQVESTVCAVCSAEPCTCQSAEEEAAEEQVVESAVEMEDTMISAPLMMAAATEVSIQQNGPRIVAKCSSAINSVQWQRADAADGSYTDIVDATGTYYDITAADEGKYIRAVINGKETTPVGSIGKLVVFYIDKGKVSLDGTYSGKDSSGNTVSGPHVGTNLYVITQNNETGKTKNTISFSGHHPNAPFDVTLDGVNMGEAPTNPNQAPGSGGISTPDEGHISIPAKDTEEKHVTIRLKGENQLRNITYYNGGDTQTPATVNSELKITDINGDGAVSGSLYIPEKVEPADIDDFVGTKKNNNHWNAAIGGLDGSSLVQNLHIAGGKLQVLTTLGDNCTAIGAGGNGYCQMTISGGEIIAHCNGTGTAIGGGIGWQADGGPADVTITGGIVYAKNHANITSGADQVGGVAIGGGSSFLEPGSRGNVTITGGTIEAYGTFGNGLGGGNSSTYTGGEATIIIGNDNDSELSVTASSIGGGNSKKGEAGSATVTVTGANTTVILNGGIGGGMSENGAGGAATVTVNSGTLKAGGSIGGGTGNGSMGNGGNATVIVNGGTLIAESIGGGNATVANGGDATVTVSGGAMTASGSIGGGQGGTSGNGGAAIVTISNGTMTATSIGGGTIVDGSTGKLGYAKANISSGDISGQFLLMAGGTEPCTFTMTGGTLSGVDTTTGSYKQSDGAAVYMDDSDGVVTISGGTIKDCSAAKGGAIYMSDGTCTISDEATISNCHATENGGAIYLAGGKVTMSGGTLGGDTAENGNTAVQNGGAIYLEAGTVNISGGTVRNNKATQSGGAVCVANGTVTVSGGTFTDNAATQNGGAVYLGGGTMTVNGGSMYSNTASQNGGAVYVNNGTFNMTSGIIGGEGIGNRAQNGGAVFVNGGNVNVSGGAISHNTAANNGGGVAVSNGNYHMVGGSVNNNTATGGDGGGIYVSSTTKDVVVGIYSGSVSSNTTGNDGGALAVVGAADGTNKINVQIGVNEKHIGVDSGCNHDCINMTGGEPVLSCPDISGNHSDASGGAVFVTGSTNTTLDIFCLTETTKNTASGDLDAEENSMSNFMKMEGGKVTITTVDDDGPDENAHYGNTKIQSSIYVTGGQMDLYGEMTNPEIKDIITVDITKDGDYFNDSRKNTAEEKYYKLIYYENFLDPVTGVVTGQYKAYSILHDTSVTIAQSIYDHAGYTIVGWNTGSGRTADSPIVEYYPKENGAETTQTTGWYKVNGNYIFNGAPIGDLELFASWESNGYIVKYEPNVPTGETYYGDMGDPEGVNYDETKALKKNAYSRPGYVFLGWSREATATVATYTDEQLVKNLTTKKGEVVILYAVWQKCEHTNVNAYTYTVIDNGARDQTLTRECPCKGYSETVQLIAKNGVYKMDVTHPVTVVYSSETWKPNVEYVANDGDELRTVDGVKLPYHAGNYTAKVTQSVTIDGETTEYTISVTYAVAKADQPAPEKPTFDVFNDAGSKYTTLKVKRILYSSLRETDANYKSVPQYRVVYYDSEDVLQTLDWAEADVSNDGYALMFSPNIALTNYYVEARYGECNDYNASPIATADSVYFFVGNVTFLVERGEGVDYKIVKAEEEGEQLQGILVQVWTKDGYFFPQNYTAVVKATSLEDKDAVVVQPTLGHDAEGRYNIGNIQNNCQVVLTLPPAAKAVTIISAITEKQVFGEVTGDTATISRDSAYTAYFHVDNYSADHYGAISLQFSAALPKDTTVILQDKAGGYYRYKVDAADVSKIELAQFIRMGTDSIPFAPRENMELQFVVDFSQTENGVLGDTITTTLSIEAGQADAESSEVKVSTENADTFTLTGPDTTLRYTHTKSAGAASKWDGRERAIVFTPLSSLPADARLSLSCIDADSGESIAVNTTIYADSDGTFTYTLPTNVDNGNITVSVLSNLTEEAKKAYMFTADWYISCSGEGGAPRNGHKVGSVDSFIAYCTRKSAGALRIDVKDNQKMFTQRDEFTANIKWQDLPVGTVLEVTLLRKGDNGYVATGIKETFDTTIDSQKGFRLSLANSIPGSYCLHLSADLGLETIGEKDYYFLVEQPREVDDTRDPTGEAGTTE